mgnify:CR=1 FL=1
MDTLTEISNISPFPTALDLFNSVKSDVREPFESKKTKGKNKKSSVNSDNIGAIIIQFLCCLISFYAIYINLKCNCGDAVYFFVFSIGIMCCPLCIIPYLYYKHFAKGCGRGRIG